MNWGNWHKWKAQRQRYQLPLFRSVLGLTGTLSSPTGALSSPAGTGQRTVSVTVFG